MTLKNLDKMSELIMQKVSMSPLPEVMAVMGDGTLIGGILGWGVRPLLMKAGNAGSLQ